MGMLYDINLPKISCNTINIYLCDRTVSTIDLWHTTGMFGLNTSDTTRLGLIACTDLREDNPFSFDLNFFHDFG